MIGGAIASFWGSADNNGKLSMMQRALETNCPIDVDLLNVDKEEMDSFAKTVGLVPVFVATVDGCGLSCKTPGVVSPAIANQYLSRKFS